jgi:hypothetical protein
MSPKYTAFSQVRVLSDPDKPFNDKLGTNRQDFKIYLETQAGQITSRPIIQAALRRDEIKGLNLSDRERDPAYIQEELKVDFRESSELLTILFSASDQAVATTLVKAITAAYMEGVVYAEKDQQLNRVEELRKAYNEANNTLKAKRKALEKLGEDLKTQDPAVILQQQMERMQSLTYSKQQWSQTRFKRLEMEADINAHDEKMRALEKMPVPEHALQAALDADPVCKRLEDQVEKFEAIARRYERNTINPRLEPTYIGAKTEVADLQKKLEKRRAELRAKLVRQAAGGRATSWPSPGRKKSKPSNPTSNSKGSLTKRRRTWQGRLSRWGRRPLTW